MMPEKHLRMRGLKAVALCCNNVEYLLFGHVRAWAVRKNVSILCRCQQCCMEQILPFDP